MEIFDFFYVPCTLNARQWFYLSYSHWIFCVFLKYANKQIWRCSLTWQTSHPRKGDSSLSLSFFFFFLQTQFCLTLCDPMSLSTPGLPVHHQPLEFTQTHVHWVGDAIQPSHPLSSPSPPALNLSQHQGLFKWVSSSHQVAKVMEFQLQHQSFQWTLRPELL